MVITTQLVNHSSLLSSVIEKMSMNQHCACVCVCDISDDIPKSPDLSKFKFLKVVVRKFKNILLLSCLVLIIVVGLVSFLCKTMIWSQPQDALLRNNAKSVADNLGPHISLKGKENDFHTNRTYHSSLENSKRSKELARAREELAAKNREINDLKITLKTVRSKLETVEAANMILQEDHGRLIEANEELYEHTVDLNKKIDAQVADYNILQNACEEWKASIDKGEKGSEMELMDSLGPSTESSSANSSEASSSSSSFGETTELPQQAPKKMVGPLERRNTGGSGPKADRNWIRALLVQKGRPILVNRRHERLTSH